MTDDEGDQRADRSRHRAVISATLAITTAQTDRPIHRGNNLFRPGDVERTCYEPSARRVPANHRRPWHIAPLRPPAEARVKDLRSCPCAGSMPGSQASLCLLPRPGDRSRHRSRRAACAMCSDNTDGVPLCCHLPYRNQEARSSAVSATRNATYSNSRKALLNPAAAWPSRIHAARPGVEMPGSGRLP